MHSSIVKSSMLLLVALCAPAQVRTPAPATAPAAAPYRLSADDDRFLEDLSRRTFAFFWEQADPATGIIRDRSTTAGAPANENARNIGSIAAVGFGLSGLCIAAARGWHPRADVVARAETTLRWFAERMPQERGWFYHFVHLDTGARAWQSELSSIDTRAAPRRRAHRPPLLRRRRRRRPLRGGDLPARRFPVDARRRHAPPVARLAAGVGIPAIALGSLLRADDPVSARHRFAHPSDPRRRVARVDAADHDDSRTYNYVSGARSAVRASVLAGVDRLPRTGATSAATGSRTPRSRREPTARSASACRPSSPATPRPSGALRRRTAARATWRGADRRGIGRLMARSCQPRRRDR